MFTAHASITLSVAPEWVWLHASNPDFLWFIPPVSAVESIDDDHLGVYIERLQQDGYCVVKSTLCEPPHRIAWHSVGGALHLRAEIVIEREKSGSRLTVQLYALPRDAQMYATTRLERAFEGLGEALRSNLERFAKLFALDVEARPAMRPESVLVVGR